MQKFGSDTEITVSSKGQIVIPRNIREMAGLYEGAKLHVSLKPNGALELRPEKGDIRALFGFMKYKGRKKSVVTASSKKGVSTTEELIEQAIRERHQQFLKD